MFQQYGGRRNRILTPLVLAWVGTGLGACGDMPPQAGASGDYKLEILVPGSPMHGVHGLAFDKNDLLYGASLSGYSIYHIDTTDGEVTTIVPPPLGNSDDLAFAPDGTLAWTAGAYSAVHALGADSKVKVLATDLPAVNSINYSPDGRLFVTRVFGGDALYELDPAGEGEPRMIASKLGGLNGFEVTADNQLYGPLFLKGKLVRVDLASGEVTEIADGFKVPAAVNMDSQGRLFIVDFADGSVTRMDLEAGTREVIAQLEPPLDNLAINSRDRIYVSNPALNAITEIDPDSGVTRAVTGGDLSAPGGITVSAVDGKTVVMVADFWGNRHFDANSGERTMMPVPQGVTASASIAASDDYLVLASIWPFGLVYVIDRQAQAIVKTAKFESPYSPVFMPDGSVIVADYGAGTLTRLAAGKSRDKAQVATGLNGPVGLVVADAEHVYVSEYDTGRIVRVALADGTIELITAGLDGPEGLALTSDGALLVAETGTQQLLRIDPASNAIDVVADGLAIGLQGGDDLPKPFLPTGIAVDGDDNIYISADIDNALYKLSKR
jgi:sugar lactone lactonase YvrE